MLVGDLPGAVEHNAGPVGWAQRRRTRAFEHVRDWEGPFEWDDEIGDSGRLPLKHQVLLFRCSNGRLSSMAGGP